MDATERNVFALQVRAAMDARGWTAATLAREAGMSENTISAVMNERNVAAKTRLRLTGLLALEPLAEAVAKHDRFPPHVQVILDVIGMALTRMPPAQQSSVAMALIERVLAEQRVERQDLAKDRP